MDEHKPSFDLVALNPAWVFGPHATPLADFTHLNQSTAALWAVVDKTELPSPDFMGFVDSRDVASAHLAALERQDVGGQRFILGQHFDYQSAVDAVCETLPAYAARFPKGNPRTGWKQLVEGEVYGIDWSKAEKMLGLKHRTLADCMRDSYVDLFGAERRSAAA